MAQAAPITGGWGALSPEAISTGLEYRPRSPGDTVVHRVVIEHLETFLEECWSSILSRR